MFELNGVASHALEKLIGIPPSNDGSPIQLIIGLERLFEQGSVPGNVIAQVAAFPHFSGHETPSSLLLASAIDHRKL
jgi:hypothetical protein